MEVNLTNADIRGYFVQEWWHLLARSLPWLSFILTCFQMSVFSVHWGWLQERSCM